MRFFKEWILNHMPYPQPGGSVPIYISSGGGWPGYTTIKGSIIYTLKHIHMC